jgi:uncharacterized RDD family membrane protein YckC
MSESTQELASRWKRLGGALLDSIIAMVIHFPVIIISGVFKQLSQGQRLTIGQHIFFLFFAIAVFLAVNGYLLAKHGQTVGKKLVGTRIVANDDEQILSFGRVFGLRYLPLFLIAKIPVFSKLFGIIDVLFIFRKDKRCIHDLIAGSKVVNV